MKYETGQRLHREHAPVARFKGRCHNVFVVQPDPLVIMFMSAGRVHVWHLAGEATIERHHLHEPEGCKREVLE